MCGICLKLPVSDRYFDVIIMKIIITMNVIVVLKQIEHRCDSN